MKNKLLFLFVLFLIFPFYVNAEGDNEHIYMVEEFNISGDSITMKGYSFISHRDNYGGRNLSTYIIVYQGDWNNNYINCKSNDDKCYKIKTQFDGTNRDFWGSRCTGTICGYELAVKKEVEAGNYIDTNACNNQNSATRKTVSYTGSSCLYYNVGFSVTIDLNTIFNKFSDNSQHSTNVDEKISELKFKIMASIDSKNNIYDINVPSDLGVYNVLCKKDGQSCENGIISTSNYELTVGDMRDTAYYDATRANAKIDENGTDAQNEADGKRKVFAAANQCNGACYYKILDVSNGLKNFTYKSVYTINALAFKLQAECQLDDSGECKSYDSGTGIGNVFPSTNSGKGYWTSGDRIKVVGDGTLTLKDFKKKIVTKNCKDVFSDTTVTSNTANCGAEEVKYNQCVARKSVIGYIYYPSSIDCADYRKMLIDEKKKVIISDLYEKKLDNPSDTNGYIKINVVADILLNQSATFRFGAVNPKVIVAGKGFTLGNTYYNNTVTWVNANYTSDGSPYYRYGDDWTFNGDQSNPSCYSVPLDLSSTKVSKVYYQDINGNLVGPVNIEEAFYEAINTEVMKDLIKTDNVNNIKIKSCDSNDSSGCNKNNPNKIVDGSWSEPVSSINRYTDRGTLGKSVTNKYIYTLDNSYVVVAGNEAGLIKYKEEAASISDDLKATGKKFYIDFKWNYYNNFPFNLAKDINPSLLNGSNWNWKLNGTCEIDVKQGYYRHDEGDDGGGGDDPKLNIKYRSIAIDNPFPKGIVASNWIEWFKQSVNQTRIKESYLYKPLYEISLSKFGGVSKFNGVSPTVKLSDIKSITTHYNDRTNIRSNGSSDFVSGYFSLPRSIAKSYCPSGQFYDYCDETRGGS